MCGIVGYSGKRGAQELLLECLGRLEYRGYDSAGLAIINDGELGILRSVGDHAALRDLLNDKPLAGSTGIAHTRWATHGRATVENSHPLTDCDGTIAVVHNGIIENHMDLKEKMEEEGHRFSSQTDSEVIAHLIEENIAEGLKAAVIKTMEKLEGAYALAAICLKEPSHIVVARHGGPPLIIGHGDDGFLIASDIAAILQYTQNIQPVEDNEVAEVSDTAVEITSLDGETVQRPRIQIAWANDAVEKRGFAHYMMKEIHEQPQAIVNTVRGQNVHGNGQVTFPDAPVAESSEFIGADRIAITACGSSWHAALLGKYLIESLAGTTVDVDVASEYRHRPVVDHPEKFVIAISQSGETADTLGAVQAAKQKGAQVLSICNVPGSSMSRESDGTIYTHAGPEIGVASTKTFTCQAVALALIAISLGVAKRRLSPQRARNLHRELTQLPFLIKQVLSGEEQIAELAGGFDEFRSAMYIGRGALFPLAIEGALKLKEISYIHAEAYPAGELKHGAIALIDNHMPVVALAPKSTHYSRVLSSIHEIRARDGVVTAFATEGDSRIGDLADHVFHLPETSEMLTPILMAVPLQLLAYHIANRLGCPIDKPRNLAKSVTVE